MSVGLLLRQARESAGMSIEELSTQTSVRARVLDDLENDNFQSSGGLAYARLHIRNIAKVLHANTDLLIEEFNSMNSDLNRPMIDLLSENSVTPALRQNSKVSFGLMAKAAAVLVALLIAVPTAASFIHTPKKSPTTNVALSTQTPATTSASGAVPDGTTAVATKTTPVAVVVTAVAGATWLGVSDSSGTQLFSGMLASGATRSFDDSQLINLTIGNAGAVDLNVNGKDAGTPGTTGEVVHLQFGPGASSQG